MQLLSMSISHKHWKRSAATAGNAENDHDYICDAPLLALQSFDPFESNLRLNRFIEGGNWYTTVPE